jgi:hypothetical protein
MPQPSLHICRGRISSEGQKIFGKIQQGKRGAVSPNGRRHHEEGQGGRFFGAINHVIQAVFDEFTALFRQKAGGALTKDYKSYILTIVYPNTERRLR